MNNGKKNNKKFFKDFKIMNLNLLTFEELATIYVGGLIGRSVPITFRLTNIKVSTHY